MLIEIPDGSGYFEAADVSEVYPDSRARAVQLVMRGGNTIAYPTGTGGNFNIKVREIVDLINDNKCC